MSGFVLGGEGGGQRCEVRQARRTNSAERELKGLIQMIQLYIYIFIYSLVFLPLLEISLAFVFPILDKLSKQRKLLQFAQMDNRLFPSIENMCASEKTLTFIRRK